MEGSKRIAEADLSSWSREQEDLIKNALVEYKNRSPRARGLSWQDVQADVEDLTGTSMGGKDHFRQYIAGTRPATDNAERRRAIVEFLTHPDIGTLHLHRFLDAASGLHVPLQLLDYLRTDLDPVGLESPLSRICGFYVSDQTASRKKSRVELQLARIDGQDWILRVTETRHHLRKEENIHNVLISESQRISSGWCVLTPEDNLLFFLKDDQFGKNHYYHLLDDIEIWTDRECLGLALMRYDYPDALNGNVRGNDTLFEGVHVFDKVTLDPASHRWT